MTPEEANSAKAPKNQSQKKSTSGLLPIFALIIAVIALLGVIYISLFSSKANLMGGSSKQSNQLQTKNQELTQSITQLKSVIVTLQEKMKNNQLAVTKIVGDANNGQQRWLFAEADYLLKMANITLQFRHNVPVTIALLKSADRRLFDIGDPKLYPVREIIANNITQLEALPKLDMVGLYLHLQALRLQAQSLPLATNRFVNVDSRNLLEQYTPEKSDAWHNALHTTSQALGKFLVVRHRKQQIEPLVSPQQDILLKQNVYLLFSQAQWSLLNRQNNIYQQSLSQLEVLINNYYADNDQTSQIVMTLKQLAKINVAPNMPDISRSLDALRKLQNGVSEKKLTKSNQSENKDASKTKASETKVPEVKTNHKVNAS